MEQSIQQTLLRKRLLNDIAELQRNPYPGIKLHIQDQHALQQACLILSPQGEDRQPLHLTIYFNDDYPLSAPEVTIQSAVSHPNIYDDYICASILNTDEGYTSAYTLKSICIQLLSFFCSDKVEQQYGGVVDMKAYVRQRTDRQGRTVAGQRFRCAACGFGKPDVSVSAAEDIEMVAAYEGESSSHVDFQGHGLTDLPPELLLVVCDRLDEEDLMLAARAWNGFGRVIRRYNVIRTREMQCFTLKEGFGKAALGVGVHTKGKSIQSEFDLLSSQAFFDLGVRKSVQGLPFEHWLPLPISQIHWQRVRRGVDDALNGIGRSAGANGPQVDVLYSFMNDITVRLSAAASEAERGERRFCIYGEQKNTLMHASEKAIESYFHLFHLLLCLAVERKPIAEHANTMITNFLDGKRDKHACPNLGHLLIMVLISDTEVTETLTRAIITEAITRNVVWLLDSRGAGMADLSFMETDEASDYRLQKTFQASATSYRLLMFSNLMRKCVSTTSTATGERMTRAQLRDDLFTRHGAPPHGAAGRLAQSIRAIQKVQTFPDFLQAMDIPQMPGKAEFTSFLRRTVAESMDKGYSKWALTQEEALLLRLRREPGVGRSLDMQPAYNARLGYTFFPQQGRGGGSGRGGTRGGGRGRG